MAIINNGAAALGERIISPVYHGSPCVFNRFDESKNNSIGIHFGDLQQAKHFAKADGQIIKAKLHFKNLFDVKRSDLGWTSDVAAAFFLKGLMQSTVGIYEDVFDEILQGQTSSADLKITPWLSGAAAQRLVTLLDRHEIDGIKYTNKNEPPRAAGGVAYFVLRAYQVEILDRDAPVSGKFEADVRG